jgi:predicted RNase H-like nuclease (RuvC/YqgF family)
LFSDNKSLERTIQSLEKDVERLQRELKDQKDKTSQAQKDAREQLRADATVGFNKRDFEHQIDELRTQAIKEREGLVVQIEDLKRQLEKGALRSGTRHGLVSARGSAVAGVSATKSTSPFDYTR